MALWNPLLVERSPYAPYAHDPSADLLQLWYASQFSDGGRAFFTLFLRRYPWPRAVQGLDAAREFEEDLEQRRVADVPPGDPLLAAERPVAPPAGGYAAARSCGTGFDAVLGAGPASLEFAFAIEPGREVR
jgi:hypothetical protein